MRAALQTLLACAGLAGQTGSSTPRLVVDNPWVRVERVDLPPGGSLPLSEHPDRVRVHLNGARGLDRLPDGRSRPWQVSQGEVRHLRAGRDGLAVEGPEGASFIDIGLKPDAPSLPGPYPDGPEVAPANIRCEFEDARIRVLRIRVGPQEALPLHAHAFRVVVELTGSTFMTAAGGAGTVQGRDFEPGTTAWVDHVTWHKEMNTSVDAYERITVEFKSGAPPLQRLKVGDAALAYSVQGAGPALVLVHGDPQDVRDLQADGVALAKAHRVVAYSRRGHFPGTASGPVAAGVEAEDLKALCQSLGLDRVVLVGRGPGAAAAQRLAASSPRLVRALVLVAPERPVQPSGAIKVVSSAEASSPEALTRVVQSYVSGLN